MGTKKTIMKKIVSDKITYIMKLLTLIIVVFLTTVALGRNLDSNLIKKPAKNPNLSPRSLIVDLYKKHKANKSPFFQTKNRALLDKYFDKRTADMIWKDANEMPQGDIGVIDGDPLYNSQDVKIKNFNIGTAKIKSQRATLHVTFENYDEKNDLIFMLIQRNKIWKIQDIAYSNDKSTLTGWFKDNKQ